MAKFESTITGTKSFGNQTMKNIDIPDESNYTNQSPQQSYQGNNEQFRQDRSLKLDQQAIQDFNARYSKIDDPSADEIYTAKKERQSGKEKLSVGAKKRLEMLIGMTRSTREVEIDKNIYILQSLKSKELRDVITAAAAFDGSVQFPFEFRKQILARSLVQIAGMEMEQFIGSSDLEVKLEVIEEMDHNLSLRLYREYTALVQESQEKYSIKNEEEVKELVEDLKKV